MKSRPSLTCCAEKSLLRSAFCGFIAFDAGRSPSRRRLSAGQMINQPVEPERDCPHCPRLVEYRQKLRREHSDWFNAPVPSFGSLSASILVVGLAPGVSGANRTGRPFTGDAAGEILYPALKMAGLAQGVYRADLQDDFQLVSCRVTNAVRCVPPQNRPLTRECVNCSTFLRSEIGAMPRLKIILALGAVAHRTVQIALNLPKTHMLFAHGATHSIGKGWLLVDSYHCSRQNIASGRLTAAMFLKLLTKVNRLLST